jgi:endonuclease/exonuclease/phosphatase family metal-dependent hydrolase
MRRPFRGARVVVMGVVVFGLFHVGCKTARQEATTNLSGVIESAARRSAGDELRVMTFNIRVRTIVDIFDAWNTRRDLLVRTVRDFDPDILGTQECLAEQSDYLKQELAGYEFVGVGRDDGARGGEMCGVFFRGDRFDKIDSGHFWLSESPEVAGSRSWGSAFTRMATWVKIREKTSGRSVCVVNTHFDVFGSRARLESAKLVRARIQSIAPGLPCIITGDFNDEPGSAAHEELLAGSGVTLIDVYRASNPNVSGEEGTRHEFSGRTNGPRIDWIVTSRELQPIESAIVHTNRNGKYPSDHFPVTAVLKLQPPTVTLAD